MILFDKYYVNDEEHFNYYCINKLLHKVIYFPCKSCKSEIIQAI